MAKINLQLTRRQSIYPKQIYPALMHQTLASTEFVPGPCHLHHPLSCRNTLTARVCKRMRQQLTFLQPEFHLLLPSCDPSSPASRHQVSALVLSLVAQRPVWDFTLSCPSSRDLCHGGTLRVRDSHPVFPAPAPCALQSVVRSTKECAVHRAEDRTHLKLANALVFKEFTRANARLSLSSLCAPSWSHE